MPRATQNVAFMRGVSTQSVSGQGMLNMSFVKLMAF